MEALVGAAQKLSQNVEHVDIAFVEIARDLFDLVTRTSSEATQKILDMSSSYLNERAQTALRNFYDLYFNDAGVAETKASINVEVDDIFEQASAANSKGESLEQMQVSVKETSDRRNDRVGLSAVQKELETIITLDSGMKDKLMPVLSSMQFDDMLSHRLKNIMTIFDKISATHGEMSDQQWQEFHEEVLKELSSAHERKQFYEIVLKTEAPSEVNESEMWFG